MLCHQNGLLGVHGLREMIESGIELARLESSWHERLSEFATLRRRFLIYS